MRISFLTLAALILLGGSNVGLAQSNSDVIKGLESRFQSIEDFNTVYDFVIPSDKDSLWRQVPWIPSLWEGMQVAKKANKPMFIWAMNGDPLGCV